MQSIRSAFARDSIPTCPSPFLSSHSHRTATYPTPFTSRPRCLILLRARVECDDTDPVVRIGVWEKVLESHVLKTACVFCPQAPAVQTRVADAFTQGGKLLADGRNGQDAFGHTLWALCRGFGKMSPAAVMQTLLDLVARQGTPFSVFLGELRLLVSNVRCVEQVAPEGSSMHLAIKPTIYQFASLSA